MNKRSSRKILHLERIPYARKWIFLCLSILVCWIGVSCAGTVTPFLRHMKRPTAMATATIPYKNDKNFFLFIPSADLDRVAVMSISRRSFVIDSDLSTPGILYLKTGRHPIDVAVSPDQKRLFVLHNLDGDIMIMDTQIAVDEEKRKGAKPARVPANCAKDKKCWKNPRRIVLYDDTDNKKLLGVVALGGENAVILVDLTEGSSELGKEVKRFPIEGTPSDILMAPDGKVAYVTNLQGTSIYKLDLKAQTAEKIDVKTETSSGAVSLDGKFLYLLDLRKGGITIYDLAKKAIIPQGNTLFPEETNIQIPGSGILGVRFLPELGINIQDVNGNTKTVIKKLAWLNGSDGYGYLVDVDNHRLLDSNERGPSVSDMKISLNGDSLGDPRNPSLKGMPRITISDDNKTGITLYDQKTRSETWKLTYEGEMITDRLGRFLDPAKGHFIDYQSVDFEAAGVQVGDQLFFKDCKKSATNTPDAGGAVPESSGTTSCSFEITRVNRNRVDVKIGTEKPPEGASLVYSIRTKGNYVVTGSFSGVQKERAVEGKEYKNRYFALTIKKGEKATPQGTLFQFSASSGVSTKRLKLRGLPVHTLLLQNHLPCTKDQCNGERCKGHLLCRVDKCNANATEDTDKCSANEDCDADSGQCVPRLKLWILEPTEARVFVVSPTGDLRLESSVQ